jgi:hypothetical protein
MSYVVVKDFKSVNRKFRSGDKIDAADIDPGSVHSLEDWIKRGFVKAEGEPAAKSKPFAKADAE